MDAIETVAEPRQPLSHEFLFGSTLEDTVAWIVDEAIKDGSPQSLLAGYHQLHGIYRFLLHMRLVDAELRVSNTMFVLRELAEDEPLRNGWLHVLNAYRTELGSTSRTIDLLGTLVRMDPLRTIRR